MIGERIWLSVKIISICIVIGLTVYVGGPLVAKVMSLLEKKEELYNEQMIRIADNMVSQRIEFSNKLLEAKIENLNDKIISMAEKRDQEIIAVGEIVASLRQDMKEQRGFYYKDKEDSSKDYQETVIKKTLEDGSELPVAWAMYSPNIEGEEKWTTGSYPIKIHTKVAIGENEDRSDAYVESYMTSDVFNADKGKKFPITVDSVEWVQAPPKEKRWMFNPRVSLGFGVTNGIMASLETSFFSYGRTKGDMDWRFLSLGIGASSDHEYLYFAPVEYNVGKALPIIENLFISPFIGVDDDNSTIWGAQIQIPF